MYAASSSSESSFDGAGTSRAEVTNVGFGGTFGDAWGEVFCASPKNLAGLGAGLGFAAIFPALTGRGFGASDLERSGDANGTVMFLVGFGDLSGGGPPREVRIGAGLGLRTAAGAAAWAALFCSNILTSEVVGGIEVASVGSEVCDKEGPVRAGAAFAAAGEVAALTEALNLARMSFTVPAPGSESFEVLLELSIMLLRRVSVESEAGVCLCAARLAAMTDGERARPGWA